MAKVKTLDWFEGGDFSGGGYLEDEYDLGYGGLDDPTTGDLGTIPDPMTTVGVVEEPSFDPSTGELGGGWIGDAPGFPDFGGTPGFDGGESPNPLPPLIDPGFGNDDPGGELTAGSGGTDPVTGADWSGILGTAGNIFGSVLGGLGDILNGSNKGVGNANRTPTQPGSPSAPVNTNPTTKPVGFIDVHAENTTTFLVLAFGLVAIFLVRK